MFPQVSSSISLALSSFILLFVCSQC
jgi:hypothetical protein